MGLVINTNLESLVAQRSLNRNTNNLNKSMERLSTGFRINRAADDAAGLVISETLKAQYRGADVAKSNAQGAINLLQVAEGDLSVMHENLQRVRELAIIAANDTNSTAERSALQSEISARLGEIDRMSDVSSFNGKNLLDGTAGTLIFQVGAGSSSNNQITADVFGDSDSAALGITTDPTTLTTAASAASFIDEVDTAIANISSRRSSIGSIQNRLDSTIESLTINSENLKSAHSRIRDVDVAQESSNLVQSQILQQASLTLLSQANQAPALAMSLI